ncbi:hypothetical protein QRX60_44765 [Amycolatopsis mongoliensis]|uniref:Uncharacterized protein n=1 Tax=Amycolatopsis mongoliensis TaxID=715475 RepID=A0A9Y2JNR1_9PSEU|nr:hypothetical protein [Amycolatopsis sp. 4-36]WIY01075.1 hypothetical protein QRX60_44765 [Amycolatopsis sp. 4-36]
MGHQVLVRVPCHWLLIVGVEPAQCGAEESVPALSEKVSVKL